MREEKMRNPAVSCLRMTLRNKITFKYVKVLHTGCIVLYCTDCLNCTACLHCTAPQYTAMHCMVPNGCCGEQHRHTHQHDEGQALLRIVSPVDGLALTNGPALTEEEDAVDEEEEEEEGTGPLEEAAAVSSRPASWPTPLLLCLSASFSCMRASAMTAAGLPGSVAICIDATCSSWHTYDTDILVSNEEREKQREIH